MGSSTDGGSADGGSEGGQTFIGSSTYRGGGEEETFIGSSIGCGDREEDVGGSKIGSEDWAGPAGTPEFGVANVVSNSDDGIALVLACVSLDAAVDSSKGGGAASYKGRGSSCIEACGAGVRYSKKSVGR